MSAPVLPTHSTHTLSRQATETQRYLHDGATSITQIIKDHQARLEERDGLVHAWVSTQHANLLKWLEHGAQDNENQDVEKALLGVTIGVKDVFTTNDMPTKYGSKIYDGCIGTGTDASVVALCREQGALILGKTVTAEFASGAEILPTNNPRDLQRTTGYSSAGSAAAVADYQCHVAIGNQTIGSIIEPASFTGIFGYKPTWGSIDTNGCFSSSPSLETIGFFARCVVDLQILAGAVGIIPGVPSATSSILRSCRFAFIKTDQFTVHASEDLQHVWRLAMQVLSDAGASIEEIDLGPEYDNMGNSYEICDEQVANSLKAHYLSDRQDMSQGLAKLVETGGGISHLEAQRHRDHMASLRPKFDKLARQYSAIITPSCAGEAPIKAEYDAETRFCGLWTALHVPVISVPGFVGSASLPIGLSLVGPRHGDESLLDIASLVAQIFTGNGSEVTADKSFR